MAEHLFELGSGWALWRQIFLRGSGFPMQQVLELASPAAAAAADRVLADEAEGRVFRSAVEKDIRAGIQAPEIEKPCRKLLRRLMKGQALNPSNDLLERFASIRDFVCWSESHKSILDEFARSYENDEIELARSLAEIADDARFKEAVLWQNATAAKVALPRVREADRKASAKQRMRWRLVASYLQRYCTKNDTIGFFGPHGWAEIVNDISSIRCEPGDELLSRRRVYFEFWAIDTLARKFSQDENLWFSVVPRRDPGSFLEGKMYCSSAGDVSELPDEFLATLEACDARRTVGEIAEHLVSSGKADSEDDVFEVLEALAEAELIHARFELPTSSHVPERALRALLQRAPEDAGQAALAELAELDEKRRNVEAAAGDPNALSDAFEELNRCFERLTNESSSRAAGETYAGRTLVYEDCIRGGDVKFGEELMRRLSQPLMPVLLSARWFCWEIAARYRVELRKIFDRLAAETGNAEVRFLRFQQEFVSLFPGPQVGGGIVDAVRLELQARWESILSFDPVARHVEIELEAIAGAARESFAAPGPGWPSARHHSPDILLSAKGPEALESGDFEAVLGEIHVGHNTVGTPDNAYEHLDPDSMARAREHDLPVGITPTWNQPIRVMLSSLSAKDFEYESGEGLSHRPREKVLSIGACFVFLKDDELYVRSREGGPEFHLMAFIDQHLIAESYSEFQMLGRRGDHTPRISVGGLVLQRETWRMDAADVAGTKQEDRVKAFLEIRRWAKELGLPRYIFVKTEAETKPFFVDLDSALLTSNFLRHAQTPGRISISEMLPDFDHAWLEDGEGQRYCSELRLCYLDPEEWRP